MKITIRVKTGAAHEGVSMESDGTLVVRVHARPVDGAANAAIREVLAKTLGVAKSTVVVETPRGRCKIISIPDAAVAALAKLSKPGKLTP